MLKADISKAFDTVQWPFIVQAMKKVNFPPIFIHLVQSCLSMSRVTIQINGGSSGCGFISPTWGLRQGCPLSPFLFIITMEFLTKQFALQQQKGCIKGITLAKTAPSITHVLYADDLMVTAKASHSEVTELQRILESFGQASGLSINPDKSTIWFSRFCNEECKMRILSELKAQPAAEDEKYLGIVVSQSNGHRDTTHDMLVDRMYSKLAGWKINLLSFAGRVTLLQSVLMTLPVYYMSVAVLPTRTIKAITSLMCRFLWGKMDQDRYISFISWYKICTEKEQGGLGFRNMKLFNHALILKLVWQVASNEDKLWVMVVRAKYYPRGGF